MQILEDLAAQNTVLQQQNLSLQQQVLSLQQQLDWLKRQLFGKRSEKIVERSSEQLCFEGFAVIEETSSKAIPAYTRKAPKQKGTDIITLPPDMPVERTILDLSEEEKVGLVKIGEETSHKLAFKPGSYYIKEIVRPKYANPEKEEAGVFFRDLPDSIIPKCRADESFLAEILTRKFGDHLPLYRLSEILSREGVGISRQLLCQWVVKTGLALEPLYNVMIEEILLSQNVFVDETPVALQEQDSKAYMWVIAGGNERDPPNRAYCFYPNRSHENAQKLLRGYRGVLHSDKYGAYETLAARKEFTWCPCWSHIRRKFFEASPCDFESWVLRKIRYLFMLEKVAWNCLPEERLRIRQEKEVPLIDELIGKIKERLSSGRDMPKSKLREALGYFCGLIPYLKNYTQYANARLDNNVAERAVRPLALGRKNWLFFGSADGAKAGAIILSLSCRPAVVSGSIHANI